MMCFGFVMLVLLMPLRSKRLLGSSSPPADNQDVLSTAVTNMCSIVKLLLMLHL
jgi:hypothetical protein